MLRHAAADGRLPSLGLCGMVAVTSVALAGPPAWPRFRGPDGAGVAEDTGIPDSWSPDDFDWVADLPGEGHGSPVVADGIVAVPCHPEVEGRGLSALAVFDADTGREIWRQAIPFEPAGLHRQNSFASWSAAAGGGMILYSVADPSRHQIVGIELTRTRDGTQARQWARHFPGQDLEHGFGASPVLVPDAAGGRTLAVVVVDHQGPSRIVALDAANGELVWETERPGGKGAYATPLVLRDADGLPEAVVASSTAAGLRAYDIADGRELWATPPLPARVVSSPTLAGDLVIQTCGGGNGGKLLWAVDRRDGTVRHEMKRRLPYVPTPVAYDGHLFLTTDTGVCSCVNLSDFSNVWTKRIAGGFDASPVVLDGRAFAVDNDGVVHVFAASPTFREIAAIALGERSSATPAYADGRMYLRTLSKLFCLRGPDANQIDATDG